MTDCSLTAAFAAIGGKWKLVIIYWLAQEGHHFAARRRRISSISHKVLTGQLRELEADEIVSRAPSGAIPAPFLYRLTDYGRTLLPLVEKRPRPGPRPHRPDFRKNREIRRIVEIRTRPALRSR